MADLIRKQNPNFWCSDISTYDEYILYGYYNISIYIYKEQMDVEPLR